MKTKTHNNCTILRTFERTSGTLNITTGQVEMNEDSRRMITGPCDTPLFSEQEKATGVCKTCRKGWTHEKNTFASDAERLRATGAS